MKLFKKIIVWLLVFCILASIIASVKYTVAFASEKDDFDDHSDTAYPTSEYTYYEFSDLQEIIASDDYMVVSELVENGDNDYLEYSVFENNGDFISSFDFKYATGDVQKIEIYKNTVVSLNYLADDSSMLYSVSILDYADSYVGMSLAMLKDTESHYIRDFTIADDTLYCIKVGLNSSIKKMKLGGGITTTTLGTEYDVDLHLSNYTAIESCGEDIIVEVQYKDLYYYDTSEGKVTKLNTPSGNIIQYGGYDNDVFILTDKGFYHCDMAKSTDFELVLETTDEYSNEENIVDPVSFATSKMAGVVKLIVADNEGAMALKSFNWNGNSLVAGNFAMYSFSSSEEGYHSPTHISSSYESYVVCDSENLRVKIIEDGDDITLFYPKDEDGDAIEPSFAGVDYQGNIYVISDRDDLYIYTSSGNLSNTVTEFDGSSFRSVVGLEVSPYDNTCYFASGSSVMKYDHSSKIVTCPVPTVSKGNGLVIDYFNNTACIFDTRSLDVYSLATGKLLHTQSKLNVLGRLQDVDFDLAGNFYALCSDDRASVVSKYVLIDEDHEDYEKGEVKYERIASSEYEAEDGNDNFSQMTINFEEENAYFLKDGEHRVYETDDLFDDLDVQYEIDINIPNDIFELIEESEVTILDVNSDGNRLLFPVSKKDDYYPAGYAILRTIKLSDNAKMIVTGTSEDGEISYVLYNNSVGYMYTSALEDKETHAELPFTDGLSLHDNAFLYKYPLSTTSNMLPLYGYTQLEKDTPLTVVNLANDYVCPMGMLWYRVEANVDGDVLVGYMPRYNVCEDVAETDDTYEYGRINANLFEGYAVVFADEGVTELGKKIYDGAKVEILAERNDYLYVREVNSSGDVATEGYILKELVTTSAQTRSFTIAIILIIVLIVAIIAIVGVKIYLKKRRIH